MVLILLFAIVSFFLYKKQKEKFYVGFFLVIAALLMYAPFMRLYFMYIARIENDRYNYFASVFLFPLSFGAFSVLALVSVKEIFYPPKDAPRRAANPSF